MERFAILNDQIKRIIDYHGFGYIAVGRSYAYQIGDSWAYLDKESYNGREYWSIRVSDWALQFHYKAKEWIVLHECGHIQLKHSLHSGRANRDDELEADFWACEKQETMQHGVDALTLMSNGNLDSIRMSIDWDVSVGLHYYEPFTYKYCINEIKRRWELNRSQQGQIQC